MGLFRWPRPPWSITGFCEMWQPGKARPGAVGYRNITTRGPHARVSARDASASPFRYYRCGLAQNPSSTHDIWQRAWCATFALSYSKQVAGVAISSRPHRCFRWGDPPTPVRNQALVRLRKSAHLSKWPEHRGKLHPGHLRRCFRLERNCKPASPSNVNSGITGTLGFGPAG